MFVDYIILFGTFWWTKYFRALLINSTAFHMSLPELEWDNRSTLNNLEEYFKIHWLLYVMQFQGELLWIPEVTGAQKVEPNDER